MAILRATVQNEKGAVALISLLVLVLITVMGIAATITSNIETQVAGNNKWQKIAFFAAEGGTETGIELIEQNIEETGFDTNTEGIFNVGAVGGSSPTLYLNTIPNPDNLGTPDACFLFPKGDVNYALADAGMDGSDNDGDGLIDEADERLVNNTWLYVGANSHLSTGGAIQMAAGYEGKGKSSAGGGGQMVYDIFADHLGQGNAVGRIRMRWRHMM